MELGLDGRVAVITGASRGIGAGIARRFLSLGMKVGLCSRTPLEEVELTPQGGLHRCVDVRDAEAVAAFAAEVEATLGTPELWVNNAGILEPIKRVRDCDSSAFSKLIDVNLMGVVHGAQSFISQRRKAGGGGCLINIGSGAARGAYRGWGAYCASKAAVLQLSSVLALEEADAGIRIHCLAPGIIETGMQRLIRQQSEVDFPDVERFRGLRSDGALLSAESPAAPILRLAFAETAVDDVELDVRDSPALQDLGPFEACRP